MAKGPTLVSYIEWEDFGHPWKIDTLEPSESLPQGAEQAEVWRDENYDLKAKISGTIEGTPIDIHPEVETGSLIPLFEIQGSDEYGFCDYEIGSCALGNVSSSEWRDQTSDPPIVAYEAELFTSGARWNSRHVSASEAEWLSEWYYSLHTGSIPSQSAVSTPYGRSSQNAVKRKFNFGETPECELRLTRILGTLMNTPVIFRAGGYRRNGRHTPSEQEYQLVNSQQTQQFAQRLMKEVWEPFDYTAVERFYNRDVRGHNRTQELLYDDVVHRLRSDTGRFADPLYDIKDIIASEEKFAIRFIYTATVVATGEPVKTEVNYFYHLKDGKVSEFWVLADIVFDYKA